MVDERVVEAILHGGGKLLAVVLIQRQDGHDLLQQHLVHVAQNSLVMHAVAHDVEAGEVGAQHKAGVGAVQDADLALLVRAHVGGHKDMALETGLAEGQHIVQLGVPLDDPDAKDLADIKQRVSVAVLFLQLGNLLRVADAAGDDAVDQRAAEGAVLVDILLEAVLKAPLLDVLVDALEQLLAVVVDQLAGEHDDALLAGLITVVQHLSQLAGEAGCGNILQLAGGVVDDAGLGGVGNDDLEIVAGGDLHHLTEALLLIRVQAAGNTGNDALVIDLLAVFTAAQVEGVQTLLLVDHLGKTRGDGLDQNALAVPVCLLVGKVEPIVNKCAEEVAFAELQDLFGGVFQNVAVITGFRKNIIIQGFHRRFLLIIINHSGTAAWVLRYALLPNIVFSLPDFVKMQ